MALGKQAKTLANGELKRVLAEVAGSRHPVRDKVMVLLSFKAGLRAKEIASLTWAMVTTASGELSDEIALTNTASKGKNGGREIPMHPALTEALAELRAVHPDVRPERTVVYSERGRSKSPESVRQWFFHLYARLGLRGASSHSGRRTFVTTAARRISEAGGSIRDVQALAGHADLKSTQRYIETSAVARKKVIGLI